MYAWVWQRLPGPWPVRLSIFLVLVAVVVYALFVWAFPWTEEVLDISNVTVG